MPDEAPLLPGENDTAKERRHLKWLRSWVAWWNRAHPTKKKAIKVIGGVAVAVAVASGVYSAPIVPCAGGLNLVACTVPTFDTPADTTAPTATLTAPVNGTAISGTTPLTATASDDVAVAGVTFYVDNIQVGVEDTGSPYSVSYDTTALTNGPHTITAIARDTSSNLSTPSSVNVTYVVANTTVSVAVADLWVAPSGTATGSSHYDCGGSVPCAFSATHAYASFALAFAQAQGGDTIGVACANSGNGTGTGAVTYGSQTLADNATVDVSNQSVTIAPLDGCTPTIGKWTTLTNDYKPQGYYQACDTGGGHWGLTGSAYSGFSDTCQAAHAGDSTVTVADTSAFTNGSNTIVVDGNLFDAITCTARPTSTTFTGCGSGPTPSASKAYYIRGGMNVPVWESGTGTLNYNGASFVHVQGINAVEVSLASTLANQGTSQQYTDAHVVATLGTLGVANSTVKNVIIGPHQQGTVVPTGIYEFHSGSTTWDNSNLLFDNVTWNSGNANACVDLDNGGCHSEQIFLRYANGLTIQNSTFTKSEQYAIFASASSTWGAQATKEAENVLIQNNWFGPNSCKTSDGTNLSNSGTTIKYPCHDSTNPNIEFRGNPDGCTTACKPYNNWTIRFNTLAENNAIGTTAGGADSTSQAAISSFPTPSNMVISSNYGRSNWGCFGRFTFDHEITTLTACTGTGNTGAQSFDVVSEANVDDHLNSGASAIAKGTTTSGNYPLTDHGGTARGTSPDAGASQYAAGNTGTGGTGMSLGVSSNNTVSSGGATFIYKTYKPANLADGCTAGVGNCSGVPMVVFFPDASSSSCHDLATYSLWTDCDLGTSTSVNNQIGKSQWTQVADQYGFIVVFLEEYNPTCFGAGSVSGSLSPDCQRYTDTAASYGDFVNAAITEVETSASKGANINSSQVVAAGYFQGVRRAIGEAYCKMGTTNLEGVALPAPGNLPSDWSGSHSIQANFAGWIMEAGGQPGKATTDETFPACSYPSSGPLWIMTSTNDTSYAYDDTFVLGTGNQNYCPAVSSGVLCRVRAGVKNSGSTTKAYATHYSCATGPTVTTVAVNNASFTGQSYKYTDYTNCTAANDAVRWVQAGKAALSGPQHSDTTGPYHNFFAPNTVAGLAWAWISPYIGAS